MPNLSSMKGSHLLFFLLVGSALFAAPRDTEQHLQRIAIYVDEIGYQLNHHKVEIDLFHERLKSVEDSLREGLQDLAKLQGNRLESPKLRLLEEGQKALLADVKMLQSEVMSCSERQALFEKGMRAQIQEVQSNLHKALALLGNEPAATIYTVQTGDSLGLIAQKHKVSVKLLKETNNLSNDQIYVGQKLKLP